MYSVTYYKLVINTKPSPAFDQQRLIRTEENYEYYTFFYCRQTVCGITKQYGISDEKSHL